MRVDHEKLNVVLASVAVTGVLLGCKMFKSDDPAASDAGAAVTTTTTTAAPVVKDCTVDAPFSIDKGARLDTGLTLVKMPDGRVAIGYATGDGKPKVAMIDDSGASSLVEVAAQHFLVGEKVRDKSVTKRTVMRVTPIGMKGLLMRVGIDALDTTDMGGPRYRYLRCGQADGDPIIVDDGPSFYDVEFNPPPVDMTQEGAQEMRDCRTFSNGSETWVLASNMYPNNEDGTYAAGWVIDEKPGKEHVEDPTIDFTEVKAPADKSAPKPLLYEVPVSLRVPGGDFIMASRIAGKLVIAKRKKNLEPDGDAVKLTFSAPIGMATMTVVDKNIALLVPSLGKTEVLGATWPADQAAVKPTTLTIDDPTPPTEGDRTSLSTATTPSGDIVLGFVDGKGTTHKARLTVLTSDLKSKKAVFDVSADNASELRVSVLKDGRFFVTYLKVDTGVGEVMGAIAQCKP